MGFKLKYPRLLLVALTFVLAYFIFAGRELLGLRALLLSLGYFGAFITGSFYTYGFTTGPAAAIFLIMDGNLNIWLAGALGGLGALCGDLIIFTIFRSGLEDEVRLLGKEKFFAYIGKKTHKFTKKYIIPLVAGIIIAAPIPDEIGVVMLASDKFVKTKWFMVISYLMNTLGILILLFIGSHL
jgi:uncharacterized membrane protein YdjX (TVP38/TMEM64 family)